MVVGVNGTGKTTTVGKLAECWSQRTRTCCWAPLTLSGRRGGPAGNLGWPGVPTVRGAEGADPASVAFEAVKAGIEQEVDVVLIDTAGRLHTKVGWMSWAR